MSTEATAPATWRPLSKAHYLAWVIDLLYIAYEREAARRTQDAMLQVWLGMTEGVITDLRTRWPCAVCDGKRTVPGVMYPDGAEPIIQGQQRCPGCHGTGIGYASLLKEVGE